MEELKVGDEVVITHSTIRKGEIGIVTGHRGNDIHVFNVKLENGEETPYHECYLQKTGKNIHDKTQISLGKDENKFEKIGVEIGKFTDIKNKQYGSSVDATSKMIHVLMERYTYDENNYLIPKSLVDHILLIARDFDKVNRIFNNPTGEGDSESPYKDRAGYALIGIDMVNRGDAK